MKKDSEKKWEIVNSEKQLLDKKVEMSYLNNNKNDINYKDISNFQIIENEKENNEKIGYRSSDNNDKNLIFFNAENSEKNLNDNNNNLDINLNTFEKINSLDSVRKNELDLIKYNSGDASLGRPLKYNGNNVRGK